MVLAVHLQQMQHIGVDHQRILVGLDLTRVLQPRLRPRSVHNSHLGLGFSIYLLHSLLLLTNSLLLSLHMRSQCQIHFRILTLVLRLHHWRAQFLLLVRLSSRVALDLRQTTRF
jgi:hypothetical protein